METPDGNDHNPSTTSEKRPASSSARAIRLGVLLVLVAAFAYWYNTRPVTEGLYLDTLTQMHYAVHQRDLRQSSRLIDELVEKYRNSGDEDDLHAISWGQNVKASRMPRRDVQIKLYDEIIERLGKIRNPQHKTRVVLATAQIGKAEAVDWDRDVKLTLLDDVIDKTLNFSPILSDSPHILLARAKRMKAEAVSDPQESLRLYDEMIAEYGASTNNEILYDVTGAWYGKAELSTDPEEKAALLDKLVEEYSQKLHKEYHAYLLLAMRDKTKLVDDVSEKALLDAIIERYKDNTHDFFPRSLSQITNRRLELVPSGPEGVPEIDGLIAQLDGSPAGEKAVPALLLAKASRLTDASEKSAVYNLIVQRYKNDPDKSFYVQQAVISTPTATQTKQERIEAIDTVLSQIETEDDADLRSIRKIEMLLEKAEALEEKTERIKLYREALDVLKTEPGNMGFILKADTILRNLEAATGDHTVWTRFYDEVLAESKEPSKRAVAMQEKYKRSQNADESRAIFEEMMKRFLSHDDPEVVSMVLNVLSYSSLKNRSLKREGEKLIPYYDKIIANTENSDDPQTVSNHMEALLGKAEYLSDTQQRIALYDKILAMPQKSEYQAMISSHWREKAAQEKAHLLGDPEILAKFYRERSGATPSDRDLIRSLSSMAWQTRDKKEKAKIYDEIIERFGSSKESDVQMGVADAMLNKAKLAEDNETAIARYNAILEKYGNISNRSLYFSLYETRTKLAELIGDPTKRIALYDDIIRNAEEQEQASHVVEATLKKAELIADPETAKELREKIIERYENSTDEFVVHALDEVFLRMAKQATDPTEKVAIVDRLLARPLISDRMMVLASFGWTRAEAVMLKADALTEPSYPVEYVMELIDTGNPSSIALAGSVIEKIEDADQLDKLADTLSEKYGDSDNALIQGAIKLVRDRQERRVRFYR